MVAYRMGRRWWFEKAEVGEWLRTGGAKEYLKKES